MSRRTSRNNSYTSGMNPSGFYQAEVVAVDGDYVSVKVARLGLSNVYENVPFTGFTPAAGDRVWVSFVEGKAAHLLAFVGAGDTSSDITEIIAGLGLSGGGSSGSITVDFEPSELTTTTLAYEDKVVISDASDGGEPKLVPISEVITTANGDGGEPIGHEDKSESVISFDYSTRTFTIAPVSDSYVVWCAGQKFVKTASESVVIGSSSDLYYISFDADGVLQATTTFYQWDSETPTAYIHYNSGEPAKYMLFDERHGIVLDWQTHEYLHRTRGAAIASGFDASNFDVSTQNGSTDDQAYIDIADGTFFDEDLQVDIVHSDTPTANTWEQDLQGPAQIPVFYQSGTTGWTYDAPTNFPLKYGGTPSPTYNLNSGGTWSTPEITSNNYGISWIVATNQLNYPVIAIMGQDYYTNVGDAEAVTWDSMNLDDLPVVELRVLYKVIYRASGSNTPGAYFVEVDDYRRALSSATSTAAAVVDHGNLTGLGDDDHTQYLLVDGSRDAVELTVTGDLVVDTDTLFVDASTDRVGIGTTSPEGLLHIEKDLGTAANDTEILQRFKSDVGVNTSFLTISNIRESTGGSTWNSAHHRIQHRVDSTDMAYIDFNPESAERGLSLGTDNVERVTIDSSGNVGIGDTTPSYTLDVNGTGRFVGQLTAGGGIDGLTLANGGISGSNYNITGVNQLEINDPGEGIVFKGGASGDYSMYIIDDASDKILQVGGVTNSRVRVNAPSGNAEVELETSGVRWALFASASDNSFNLYNTIGSTDFTFTTTGRLGINDTSPSYNLDVNGTGRFTGQLTSDSYRWGGTSYLTSTTTSALESELLARDVFDSSFSAFKTGWSYAGNGNLTDAGRLTELAGTSWLTWTDNSADNTLGNYTALVIAPNTGGSAYGVFVYNDQGSSYSPGWRELWNSQSTITGPSGSAGAPAYSFSGDTDTGMYREETDMLGFSAGGEVVGLFRESTNNNSGSLGDGYVAFSTYMGGTTGTGAVIATTTISGQSVKRLMYNASTDEAKDTPVPWEMSDESYKKIAVSSFHYHDMYVDDDGMHHHWDKALALKGEQEDEPPETWVPLKRHGFMWSQIMEHEDLWPLATDLGISDPAVAAATVSVVQRLIDRVAALEARIAALEAQ